MPTRTGSTPNSGAAGSGSGSVGSPPAAAVGDTRRSMYAADSLRPEKEQVCVCSC